ncbi:MAG: hypothetical protein HQ582_08245 [Planctomycetes bacterium]|nr:hypothetical protein [Planctomycetota bacterium]
MKNHRKDPPHGLNGSFPHELGVAHADILLKSIRGAVRKWGSFLRQYAKAKEVPVHKDTVELGPFREGVEGFNMFVSDAHDEAAVAVEEYLNRFSNRHFGSYDNNASAARVTQEHLRLIARKIVDEKSGKPANLTHRKGLRMPGGKFEARRSADGCAKSGKTSSTWPRFELVPATQPALPRRELLEAYRASDIDRPVLGQDFDLDGELKRASSAGEAP